MAGRLSQVEESVTVRIADIVRETERQGEKVVKLQTGDPDFPTPDVIIEAAYAALKAGYTHYSDSRGLPELREAIAAKLSRENGLQYAPAREILVTHGGVHAIFSTINALVGEGDEVLILDPCWMPYVSATLIAGARPVRVPADPAGDFEPPVDKIEASLGPRTRLLILNSPCNPTGRVFGAEALDVIARIARRHDLYVIADEVYEKYVYHGHRHISLASLPGMKERTITVNSLSKSYAMTGWRVGYLAAPADLVDRILKVSQYSVTNIAPFVQKAAVVALTSPAAESAAARMREVFAQRHERITRELSAVEGVRAVAPQGAFYFLVDVSRLNPDSVAFATQFLREQRVAVVPGVGFGQCAEGFFRMTFAAPEDQILEGIARLRRLAQAALRR